MATNGGDVLARELMAALLTGEDVTIPVIDLDSTEFRIPGGTNSDAYSVLSKLSNADLTTGSITGTGTFDKLMVGVAAQLKGEFDNNRITGAEYTKAYIGITQSALSIAAQFLLGKDSAYWQAVQAQALAVTARLQLQTAKIQNAAVKFEAMTAKANYALSKLKLSSLDVEFATGTYNLENVLPKQAALLDEQLAGAIKDTETKTYTLDELMPVQKLNLQEQAEAQRAQTMDTRSNGVTAVTGSIGKQNALYAQQIVSYQKDSQLKAGKIFSDIWTVQKTVDESPDVPDAFGYETINDVMQTIITSNDLV